MTISILRRAALAACALVHIPALAADEPRPPVLKAFEARGVTGLKEFAAGGAVRGFAGRSGREPFVVYVTPDGNAIVGARVDVHGVPLDAKAVDDLVVDPLEDATWHQLEATRWVREGRADAPRVVYVFSDANCPWCHRLLEAAKPWVDSGKVQLRLVFVGVIKADSAAKAAAILAAADPALASEANERDFERGGIPALQPVPDAIGHALDANLALMAALGLRGTPGLVYRGADGRMKTLGGYPRQDGLAQILGPR